MEALTKAEEKIMQILWDLKRGVVRDIIEKMPDPKPPYNTVSSLIRILEKKEFVGYKAYGKTHEYFPKISKMAYRKFTFTNFLTNYFEGSPENVLSFMVKEKKLSQDDIQKIVEMINKDTANDNPPSNSY